MKKTILGLTVACLFALALGRPAGSQTVVVAAHADHAAGTYTVKIDNFTFRPETLTVPAGATVTWINRDDVPHTIVGTEGNAIKSPVLDTDQQFTYTLNKAGTYTYDCSVHPRMTGKIIVQ